MSKDETNKQQALLLILNVQRNSLSLMVYSLHFMISNQHSQNHHLH